MRIHRLAVDAAGRTYWEDLVIRLEEAPFAPPATAIEISASENAQSVLYLRLAPGWNGPRHPTPARQIIACLRGAVDVTASTGEVRRIGPGDVVRLEDTEGDGHHTRVVGGAAFEAVCVQLG